MFDLKKQQQTTQQSVTASHVSLSVPLKGREGVQSGLPRAGPGKCHGGFSEEDRMLQSDLQAFAPGRTRQVRSRLQPRRSG